MSTKEEKYRDSKEAQLVLERWRKAGKRIVFTNGCFDLLHPGHVHYLEKAKSLGDRLVIGINEDESVRRLKGEYRPINDLEFRIAILASLECVDLVVSFGDDTPRELIEMLRPDILVKGGDYSEHEVAGGDFVKSNGGKVVIIPFLPGYSSTSVIARIKKSGE